MSVRYWLMEVWQWLWIEPLLEGVGVKEVLLCRGSVCCCATCDGCVTHHDGRCPKFVLDWEVVQVQVQHVIC